MKECCIIIPVYNEIPTENEKLSISTTLVRLSGMDTFIVAPSDVEVKWYRENYKCNVFNMESTIWKSKDRNQYPNYNRMMMNVKFYKKFDEYEYMLVCQPDCLILKNQSELEQIYKMGYDYIGGVFDFNNVLKAACKVWFYKKYPQLESKEFICGNGGLSLRKITSVKKYIRRFKLFSAGEEDIFFIYFNTNWFKVGG